MIIGRGLLAKSLAGIDDTEYIYYVNGISNSVLSEIPDDNFEANEINEILRNNTDKIFIYFSTSQVNSKLNHQRPYVKHKYRMECLVTESAKKFLIVRTSNLVGSNLWNKNTLFNFLYNSLQSAEEINVDRSVIRNVMDVEDMVTLLNYYLKNNYKDSTIINLVNPVSYPMAEIIIAFEDFFSKNFIIKNNIAKNTFASFEAETELSMQLVQQCNIDFDNYLNKLLSKYYPIA